MKRIGLLQARGRGSTLAKKNMYPLNGKPMLWHFLREMIKADCLDEIGVWTECNKIAQIVEECECHVLHRPKGMVHYGSGFYSPDEWHRHLDEETEKKFGRPPYIRVWLNCNNVLFSKESLEKMYAIFVENGTEGMVFPVTAIENDLHMINPIDGYLFPVFGNSESNNRFTMYRRIGMHISAVGMAPARKENRTSYLEVPWFEGKDVQEFDDVEFAEFVLSKRERPKN